MKFESLPNQIINILPEELHQKDEYHEEKSEYQWTHEGLYDQKMKFFHTAPNWNLQIERIQS